MNDVYVVSDNIVSPLGSTAAENFAAVMQLKTGIQRHHQPLLSEQPFYGSLLPNDAPIFTNAAVNGFTKFEQILIASISDALGRSEVNPADKHTILIVSTTKGNISLLDTAATDAVDSGRLTLHYSAKVIAAYFGFVNPPIIVSNACISGLLGIITAMRLLRSGLYQHAVVAGADMVSKFVLSGFQSFQAVSDAPCKPFDAARNGINLGEAAATVVLSTNANLSKGIVIAGGAVSNDANHISGPSRTGDELHQAIQAALTDAKLQAEDIDFISAHGTATIYNDEMEAKAFNLSQLQQVPVNSLKGYYGHTLGAAGLIESIISMYSLQQNLVLPTLGFQNIGVSMPINICHTLQELPLKHCLKTASGFGGCNAAIVIRTSSLNPAD